MSLSVPDLCDQYADEVQPFDPALRSFGGVASFGGEVVTIKCFEDNSLVADAVTEPGNGRVLVVDAGGSMRCAMLGDRLAGLARDNGWAGVIMFGCIRDVEIIATMQIGVHALAAHPRKSVKRQTGERDAVVRFCGVAIRPGEFVYADLNGIILASRQLTG